MTIDLEKLEELLSYPNHPCVDIVWQSARAYLDAQRQAAVTSDDRAKDSDENYCLQIKSEGFSVNRQLSSEEVRRILNMIMQPDEWRPK